MGFEWIADPQAWVALLTLTALEIVLGIDNIIFSLQFWLVACLRSDARAPVSWDCRWPCSRAVALLLSLTWIMSLTRPLFSIAGWVVSGRDFVVVALILFLLVKAYNRFKADEEEDAATAVHALKVMIDRAGKQVFGEAIQLHGRRVEELRPGILVIRRPDPGGARRTFAPPRSGVRSS